jgi:putative transposase
MRQATKIRIYPNASQQEALAKAFGCARWFWNYSLEKTQEACKEMGQLPGPFELKSDLNARLPGLKQELEWLGHTHSQVLQSVSLHMSRAFGSYLARRSKHPQFKRKHARQSIQYPQGVKVVDGCKIYLPKIGHIKAVVHRELVGTIKTVTVSKDRSGEYYASVLLDDGVQMPTPSYEGELLGIDVGAASVCVTSDGDKLDPGQLFLKSESRLKRQKDVLARKVKGSANEKKCRIRVAKAETKLINQRKDYLHKLSRRLIDENQVIAVEDLSIKGVNEGRDLGGPKSDPWRSQFSNFLEYKAAKAGKGFIEVDPFFWGQKVRYDGRAPDADFAIKISNEAKRLLAAGWAATHCDGAKQPRRRKPSSAGANTAGS